MAAGTPVDSMRLAVLTYATCQGSVTKQQSASVIPSHRKGSSEVAAAPRHRPCTGQNACYKTQVTRCNTRIPTPLRFAQSQSGLLPNCNNNARVSVVRGATMQTQTNLGCEEARRPWGSGPPPHRPPSQQQSLPAAVGQSSNRIGDCFPHQRDSQHGHPSERHCLGAFEIAAQACTRELFRRRRRRECS